MPRTVAPLTDARPRQPGPRRAPAAPKYPVSVVLFMEGRDADKPGTAPATAVPADPWDDSRQHERRMADLLLGGLAAHPGARVVVEAGGLHVAIGGDAFTPPRPAHPPMGRLLRQAGGDIVSLKGVYGGADNHHCGCDVPSGFNGGTVSPSMVVCKEYPGPEATVPRSTPTIQVNLIDGTYYVAATSASPPTVGSAPKP